MFSTVFHKIKNVNLTHNKKFKSLKTKSTLKHQPTTILENIIVNQSSEQSNDHELNIINKGLKTNLPYHMKTIIDTIVEDESAIKYLHEQNLY